MALSFLSLPYEIKVKIIDHISSIIDIENISTAIPELNYILSSRLYESIVLLNVNTLDNCYIYNLLKRYFARDKHIVRLGYVNCLDPIEGPVKKITLKNVDAPSSFIGILGSFQNFCELNKDHLQDLKELEIKELNIFPRISNFEIPAELSNLKVLNLENNKLKRLPGLKHMKNLQELYLAGNEISSLSSSPSLPSLIKLDISSNPLFEITDLTNNFINLKHFKAQYAKLRNIDRISDLKSLEVLDLSYNHIKSLESFKDLPKLKKLYLNFNGFKSTICGEQLKHLEELDLSFDNKIKTITNLSKMSRLRSLKLVDCGLKNSINGLNDLKRLETLSLSGNHTALSRSDWSSTKIKYLSISGLGGVFGNNDDMFSLNFDRLLNLELLFTSSSKIFEDQKFAMLPKLKKLSCWNVSKIVNLPCSLEILDFSNSRNLCKIEGLSELVNLRELHLRSTGISKIENLEEVTNLEVLDLQSCNIRRIEGLCNLNSLKVLNLYNSKVREITGLTSLVNLKELKLDNCQISKLEGLSTLTKLEKLYLRLNHIKRIGGLKNLTNLTYLDLSSNKISRVERLESCTNLRDLNVSLNPITTTKGLDHLPNLYFLNLGYGRFTEDEKWKFERMTDVKEVDLKTYGDDGVKRYLRRHGYKIFSLQD